MKVLLYILGFLLVQNSFAQHSHVEFKENKGQWENNILFKAKLPAGQLYLEQNKLTYQFYLEQDIVRIGDLHHGWIKNPQATDSIINLHAFEVEFLNALSPKTKAEHACSDYENYFVGNDETKWASDVKKYQDVTYQKLYNGIDLKFYSADDNGLKYDFIVQPNSNPADIQLKYNGVDNVYLEKGALVLETSVNKLVEQKPYAYQIINGKQKEVKCNFKLTENVLSFDFPRGYNKTLPLIIDPALIFASYSGATIDNWGYTSTFDEAGNLYGGGVAFGLGYPTTTGAFQIIYNGGYCDVSISKFNPYGTNLIYSTYIGGASNDYPHSLIVNHNDELLVFGTTKSINFPTANAYDGTPNGGYDIFVAKFNSAGTTLMGSTYVGGTSDDGQNRGNPLKYNYADDFRGEIVVDENDNVFVASTTYSDNFPTTAGVIGPGYIPGDGGQNACIFKLSPSLNALTWSSYFGGTMDDAAYSLQFDELGNILFTGGTKSPDLPITPTAIKQTLGGIMDGYITKMTPDATTILACTYVGTDSLDQSFFVQLDTANNVYVLGQTEGLYPVFPSTVHSDTNSGQFIHKLTPNLDATVFSTVFGSSSGHVDISPTAFLVNECNYILVSGWGGNLSSFFGLNPYSTTNGLPVTSNAEQSTTDGQDYYLAMFAEDADTLLYATFFGGNNSRDHVDGGTSRFDKKGMVYQAVCASCGVATADFPTSPGAWSNTDNSTNCNLGVFKLDLTRLSAIADVYTTPYYCVGETVHFQNLSVGGISFFWDFADGNTSTDFEPYHVFDTAGTYHVMLAVLDSVSCNVVDTDYVDVFIAPLPHFAIDTVPGICRGDSVQLQVIGGDTIQWLTTTNISDTTIANPMVWPTVSSIYSVYVIGECGTDTLTAYVEVFQPNINVLPDTAICRGESVELAAYGGKGYLWSPNATLDVDTLPNPTATPFYTTTYTVEITDINECVWDTFMTVYVDTTLTNALVSADVIICLGDTTEIYAIEGMNFMWSPSVSLSNPTDSFTLAFPSQTTNYVLEASNACNSVFDSVEVSIFAVDYQDSNSVCLGDSVQLEIFNGDTYTWITNNNISDTSIATPMVWPTISTTYEVVVGSFCGLDTVSVFVEVYQPNISVMADTNICFGHSIQLNASGGISYLWSPSLSLNIDSIQTPIATPDSNTTYQVEITDSHGCVWDTITNVSIDFNLPTAITSATDTIICQGDTTQIVITGGVSYQWSPSNTLSNPTDSVVQAYPWATTSYIVGSTNACGTVFDTIKIEVQQVNAQIFGDTLVCVGEHVQLWANGGVSYWWEPSNLIDNPTDSIVQALILSPTLFTVNITGANGCKIDKSIYVNTSPIPYIELEETISSGIYTAVEINPETNGVTYQWTPSEGLSCTNCLNPIANSGVTATYTLTTWSGHGCVNHKNVTILFQGILYIPNTFTPNGDHDNDIFYAYGVNIKEFEMMIFDRWGEKLFTSEDLDDGWDGTYKGELAKTETYVWKIKYKDVLDNPGELIGTVTLLR